MSKVDFLSQGNLDILQDLYKDQSIYGNEEVCEVTVDRTTFAPFRLTPDDILIMLDWIVYGRSMFMPSETMALANRLKEWIGDIERED